ncbi:hypothetical protein [Streptomyces sp. NEAU-H33]|uniref:hypothetical protein n=1 Tax=Streptomyces sp. NEAU-H33 TaxID=2979463 RepID=UPI0022405571|nr:hypothetical protein [Streptomyces sp. NEAU-H33]
MPAGLVGELASQLAWRGIENGLVQSGFPPDVSAGLVEGVAGGAGHAGDVDVLDGDFGGAGGELLGQGVQVGAAPLGDLVVQPGRAAPPCLAVLSPSGLGRAPAGLW